MCLKGSNHATGFDSVFGRWKWKPIRGCPGRYILAGGTSSLTPAEIAGEALPVLEFVVETLPDRVLVLKFSDGGGLISYRKGQSEFLHTLNNGEGFSRKISQLELARRVM